MSKLAKSLIIICSTIVSILLILPGAIGYWIKRETLMAIKSHNKQFPKIQFNLKKYHYGWFRSSAVVDVTFADAPAIKTTVNTTTSQGPLYFYSENGQTHFNLGLGVNQTLISNKMLSNPIPVVSKINFLGNLHTSINLPTYSISIPDAKTKKSQLTLKNVTLELNKSQAFSPNLNQGGFVFSIAKASLTSSKKNDPLRAIKINNLRFSAKIFNELTNNQHYQIQSIKVALAGNQTVTVSNMRLHAKSQVSKQKVNGKLNWDIDNISYKGLPQIKAALKEWLPAGPFALHLHFDNLDAKSILKLNNKLNKLAVIPDHQSNHSKIPNSALKQGIFDAFKNHANAKAIYNSIAQLYSKGLNLKVDPISLKTPANSVNLKIKLAVTPFKAALFPMALIGHHNASLELSLSKQWASMLTQFTLSQYAGIQSNQVKQKANQFLAGLTKINALSFANNHYHLIITSDNAKVKIADLSPKPVLGYVTSFLHKAKREQQTQQTKVQTPAPQKISPTTPSTTSTTPPAKKPTPSNVNANPASKSSKSSVTLPQHDDTLDNSHDHEHDQD